MYVCVRERERREREYVCVCMYECVYVAEKFAYLLISASSGEGNNISSLQDKVNEQWLAILVFYLSLIYIYIYIWGNDKIVVLKKTTLQLYLKTFIEKINSGNLIMQ